MQKGLLIAGMVIIVATAFVGFRFQDDSESLVIKYEVACKDCTVSYRDAHGNSAEVKGIQDKWTYEFVGVPGQFVYLSASNPTGSETDVVIKRGGNDLIVNHSSQKENAARAGSIL
ncbi:hypothetical protein BH09BAC1_BH09BAC1_09590 [soil metagenome]